MQRKTATACLGITLATLTQRKGCKERTMSTARVISGHHGGSGNFTSDPAQFMSDEALVADAKMGHGSGFYELHERHRERMFRVAHRITVLREDAQDAVQEGFLN